MSWRGLPMAMTARRRPARPNNATNLPSSGDPLGDVDLVAATRAPEHLEPNAVLIGPEVRHGREGGRVGTGPPAGCARRRRRPRLRPASARSGSAPRRRRAATASGRCPPPPRCRRRRRGARHRRRRCRWSGRSRPASPWRGARRSPPPPRRPGMISPPSSSTTSVPVVLGHRRVGRRRCRPRCAGRTPWESCSDAKCDPIMGPSTLRNGTSSASSTVTRHPEVGAGGRHLGTDEAGADDDDPGLRRPP